MLRERLDESQKEIIRIYQETSRAKKEKKPTLTRKEVAKLFFERSGTKRSSWKNSLLDSLFTKEDETDKKLAERRFPLKIETERETVARRTEELRKPAGDITDWKKRVGLKSGLRGIYSKKQTVLRESLKDLVKKGYLERSGSGISSKYKVTERALKVKIPRF
ncbi:MAG TPA: hypothetical protein ENI19_00670 [Candidatus Nealsonbacteria bacterium]|uniref:Uncharacterized protein n=1 Tax=marine sediment metagenome TaxID=412755 RepID=A0A0F9S1L9_9ZZZZ|nr:hypothetical protein [Candidatus Nealsonbacteria bacterium]HEB46205.1 hypothetical protein [Candidatus Nealsonbacteria bacterium]